MFFGVLSNSGYSARPKSSYTLVSSTKYFHLDTLNIPLLSNAGSKTTCYLR
jgi:hypothetical protein